VSLTAVRNLCYFPTVFHRIQLHVHQFNSHTADRLHAVSADINASALHTALLVSSKTKVRLFVCFFRMLYCIVCFSSITSALVSLIIGCQLVELCVFLATCHWQILFIYVYLLANKLIDWLKTVQELVVQQRIWLVQVRGHTYGKRWKSSDKRWSLKNLLNILA